MARKLKSFQTSLGFYDLAIAAPSMKAALEAWGAQSNLFHQGVAKETGDPKVVAATMAKPGVVLRRPVGSNGSFREHAELPTHLAGDVRRRPEKPAAKRKKPPRKIGDQEARKAALAFEKEQKRREAERREEEAARIKKRERRDKTVAKAQAALDRARREHEERAAAIGAERAAIDERAQTEDDRWARQKEKLEGALRRARE